MSNNKKNEIVEKKLSTVDTIKLENKKYKSKNLALFLTFFGMALIFITFFIVCVVGVLSSVINFRIILLLELLSAAIYTIFLIFAVLYIVKYITFIKYIEKDKLKNYGSYDI